MSTVVITTGGTIGALAYSDPRHPPATSTMHTTKDDPVRALLGQRFSSYKARCLTLPQRDSKDVDGAYLNQLLTAVSNAREEMSIITHGTDKILATADFLHNKFRISRFLIRKFTILTGAMIPLANGLESDGITNLEFALATAANPPHDLAKVSIVLSDYNEQGKWKPRLYPYRPDTYEKFRDPDARFSRLRKLER